METLELIVRCVVGLLLIALNALFVLTEFALTRLRQFDESEMERHGGLARAWKMTERLEIHLTGCQLGISSTSILLGVIFEPAITKMLEPVIGVFGFSDTATSSISIVVGLVLINLAHKIWGEQAPTYFGVEQPLRAARFGAPFLYWWTKIMYPFIILGDGLAKSTLKLFGIEMTRSWLEKQEEGENGPKASGGRAGVREEMIRLLKDKSDLPSDRVQEVVNSYDIGTRPAHSIMVKISDATALDLSKSFAENLSLIGELKYSRYPLVHRGFDNYLGNIYVPSLLPHVAQLLEGKSSLEEFKRGRMVCSHEIDIGALIDRFQAEKQELAMLQKNGKIVGLITLTDALEAIVGQSEDPLDHERDGSELS